MPSIIEGYNYDIFVSYRQKDNKGDQWVTEFVDALKTELYSTFKEEISLYFDINPHDGLLETHDVGASLPDKLKCLVFIPILSRTYCDINSFAWVHEFRAFIKQASEDRYGLKVKLPSGNVTNRVLPVLIHDLDHDDLALCETILENPVRGIEFIYREPGVNRPLLPVDKEEKNQNNTNYRNQINKVALAIKEIILGLKSSNEPARVHIEKNEPDRMKGKRGPQEKPLRAMLQRYKILLGLLVFSMATVAVIMFATEFIRKQKIRNLKIDKGVISVAVLPFDNLTGDATLDYLEKGIPSVIINGLGNSEELLVTDEYTMYDVFFNLNNTSPGGKFTSGAMAESRKLGTETYITGSFQGTEDKYLILVNFVNTKTGDLIWTNSYPGNLRSNDYIEIVTKLCSEIRNILEIKAIEGKAGYDLREAYPQSSESFRNFVEGLNAMMNNYYSESAIYFRKAVDQDSTFTFASFFLSWVYSTTNQDIEAREWTIKAYRHKSRIPQRYQPWLEQWYAYFVSKNLSDIVRYTDILERSNIQSRWLWYDIGSTYCNFLQQYDKANGFFEKVMSLSRDKAGYWMNIDFYINYSLSLHKAGRHKEEKEIYKISQDLFPDDEGILKNMAVCYISSKEPQKANELLDKIRLLYKNNDAGVVSINLIMGSVYQEASELQKARMYFRNAYNEWLISKVSIKSGMPEPDYALARLDINYDLDIREGLEIVNRRLESDPDNPVFLALKGWGLFKQGRLQESMKYLNTSFRELPYFDLEVHQHIMEVEKAMEGSGNIR